MAPRREPFGGTLFHRIFHSARVDAGAPDAGNWLACLLFLQCRELPYPHCPSRLRPAGCFRNTENRAADAALRRRGVGLCRHSPDLARAAHRFAGPFPLHSDGHRHFLRVHWLVDHHAEGLRCPSPFPFRAPAWPVDRRRVCHHRHLDMGQPRQSAAPGGDRRVCDADHPAVRPVQPPGAQGDAHGRGPGGRRCTHVHPRRGEGRVRPPSVGETIHRYPGGLGQDGACLLPVWREGDVCGRGRQLADGHSCGGRAFQNEMGHAGRPPETA